MSASAGCSGGGCGRPGRRQVSLGLPGVGPLEPVICQGNLSTCFPHANGPKPLTAAPRASNPKPCLPSLSSLGLGQPDPLILALTAPPGHRVSWEQEGGPAPGREWALGLPSMDSPSSAHRRGRLGQPSCGSPVPVPVPPPPPPLLTRIRPRGSWLGFVGKKDYPAQSLLISAPARTLPCSYPSPPPPELRHTIEGK